MYNISTGDSCNSFLMSFYLYTVNWLIYISTTVLQGMLLIYFFLFDCYRTVSKSVVFIPVHDT